MHASGSLVGQRLSDHPDVRKLGFTGSTEIGKQIMKRSVNSDPQLQTASLKNAEFIILDICQFVCLCLAAVRSVM